MTNKELNLILIEDNTRLFVINKSLVIEKRITDFICHALNINQSDSKSFGHGSTSLSFSNKIQLFQDISTLDKIEKKKLSFLIQIRNKFAHVIEIESFSSFFAISSEGNNIRNSFIKWYLKDTPVKGEVNYDENLFKYCFQQLVFDITKLLEKVYINYMWRKIRKETKEKYNEIFTKKIKGILQDDSKGELLIKEVNEEFLKLRKENEYSI